MQRTFIHTYVSVDCVVFGFDGERLNILLVKKDARTNELKLPGSLIYHEEDVDDAAVRVLYELTGIKKMTLKQFRCFASPDRASKKKDMQWLDIAYQPNINRLITVAYLSISRIGRRLNNISKYEETQWISAYEVPELPFDHNLIIKESLNEIRGWVETNPSIVFELLPPKFVISQLHKLYEAIYDKRIDIRNFHKKMLALPYLTALDEKQKNVSHRAARYYKFDKNVYKKYKANL